MASRKRSFSNVADMCALQKEWDEASCPICMDHPHNAVLIVCTSHDKGCRSFICDTSYRHSNCLDRFKKTKQEATEILSADSAPAHDHGSTDDSSRGHSVFEDQGALSAGLDYKSSALRCPLCRGNVLGLELVDDARSYLNMKPRSCSRESCCFSGNYGELRRHARRDHPTVRSADVDPSRQREWRRLEDQRELNDIVSAIRSAMPGAILVGDYAIESGDRDRMVSTERLGSERRLLSTLFLFQMIGSLEEGGASRRVGRSRGLSGHRSVSSSRNQYLWGENLLGVQDEVVEMDEDEDDEDVGEEEADDEPDLNVPSDLGDNRRRRPRLRREQMDEDHQ